MKKHPGRCLALIIVALACAAPNLALAASPGGVDPHPSTHSTATPTAKARLVGGEAVAPAGAPAGVQQAIAAANSIRTKPYVWGGGHGSWFARGYDCSGAVSYALHGAKLLSSPLDSGSLESWGSRGVGRWITVYANSGHTYAVIAGLRWDTAGSADGTGPRWYKQTTAAAPGRYTVRHPAGY